VAEKADFQFEAEAIFASLRGLLIIDLVGEMTIKILGE